VPPDAGHASARAALRAGYEDRRAFIDFRVRPALQDWLDPQGGYTRGAGVQFLDTTLRWYPEQQQARLYELVALGLQSLTHWDPLFKPISWRFDTGIRTRLQPENGQSDLDPEGVWRTHGGVGLAWALPLDATLYGLAEATLDVGPTLAKDYALGPGAALGLLVGSGEDRWRAHAYAEVTRFALGERTTWLRAGVEQRVTLGPSTALVLDAGFERDHGANWGRVSLAWEYFF
jgi:hypothetical protein